MSRALWSKLSSYQQLPLHTEVVQRFTYRTMEHKRGKVTVYKYFWLAGENILLLDYLQKHWILNVHQHSKQDANSFTSVHVSGALWVCLGFWTSVYMIIQFWVTYSWNPGDRAKHWSDYQCLPWYSSQGCDFCNLRKFSTKASLPERKWAV